MISSIVVSEVIEISSIPVQVLVRDDVSEGMSMDKNFDLSAIGDLTRLTGFRRLRRHFSGYVASSGF